MALTRSMLKELLADHPNRDDVIDQIIDMHVDVIAPIKSEIAKLKEEHGGMTRSEISAEIERIEAEIIAIKEHGAGDVDETGGIWKQRYEAIKSEYEAAKIQGDKWLGNREKANALRSLLVQNGMSNSLATIVVRGSDQILDHIEVQYGKIRNHEDVLSELRGEFGQFIAQKN